MKNWRQFASILALIAGIGRIAGAAPFYLPDVANFYQHQKAFQGQYPGWNGDGTWKVPENNPLPNPPDPAQAAAAYNSPKNWWERGGGWCCTTAVSDLLYSLQKNYFPTDPALFWGELGHTWFEYQNFGIEQFYFDYFVDGKNFATILDDRGFGPTRIRYDEYFVEGGVVMHANAPSGFCGVCPNGAGTFAHNSVHDLYQDALANNRYVALNIVSTGLTAAQQDARGIWWNYHVIAGAGIDVANNLIFIADPNRNNTGSNRGVGPNAGIGWGHPYASTDLFPGTPADFLTYRLNGNTLVAVDPNELAFDGLPVAKILVLTATPEPGTFGVIAIAAVVLWVRGRRNRLPN